MPCPICGEKYGRFGSKYVKTCKYCYNKSYSCNNCNTNTEHNCVITDPKKMQCHPLCYYGREQPTEERFAMLCMCACDLIELSTNYSS